MYFILKKVTLNKQNIFHSLFFALSIIFCFNPTNNLSIKKFSRRIGKAVLENYDIAVLIRNYYFWIIIFGLLFIIFNIILTYLRNKNQGEKQIKVWEFLDNFAIVAFTSICLLAISYFQQGNIFNCLGIFGILLCYFVYFVSFLFVLFPYTIITAEFYKRIMVSVFALSCFISYIIIIKYGQPLVFLFLLFFFGIIASILLLLLEKYLNNNFLYNIFDFYTSATAFLPLITTFSIEGVYILNQQFIQIIHIRRFFVVVLLLLFIFSIIYSFIIRKAGFHFTIWKDAWVYSVIIAGVVLCANQPPLQSVYYPDIFESANYSILISDFLNFGKLPIVEHYGGHMLLGVVSGIFYGIISGDYLGAIVSPYWNYFLPAVCLVLFFLFCRKVIGNTEAFLACLVIPFESFYINAFALGFLICFSLDRFIEKPSIKNALILWVSAFLITLSRLDLGFAMLSGSTFALLFFFIYQKKLTAPKAFYHSAIIFFIFIVFLWSLLCGVKGINPINRLHEFLDISCSNPSWAYTSLGDVSKVGYFWIYGCLPFIVCVLLVYSLFSKKIKNNPLFYSFLVLSFAFFINYQRLLVRHSFVEKKNVLMIILTAWMVIPLFVVLKTKCKKLFIPSIALLFFLQSLMIFGNANFALAGIFDRFSLVNKKTQIPEQKGIQRIILSEQFKKQYKDLSMILNKLLIPSESFIDFTDSTFLYSAFNRECPVYISQSPSMLSGEFSQRQFINEIQGNKDNLPFVLFPVSAFRLSLSVDGVPLVLRHYKVAEYLYQNYQPLCRAGNYAIWCDKKRHNEYLSKINNLKNLNFQIKNDISMLSLNSCSINISNDKTTLVINAIGDDPYINNFNSLFDFTIDDKINTYVTMNYECNNPGEVQLFFANGNDDYSEERSVRKTVGFNGRLVFPIEFDSNMNFRFDIPEKSIFTITNLFIGSSDNNDTSSNVFGTRQLSKSTEIITYGYDDNLGLFHNYDEKYLPYLWANKDIKSAIDQPIILQLQKEQDLYKMPLLENNNKSNGNYILLHLNNNGNDTDLNMVFGLDNQGIFTNKYNIKFMVKNGEFDYILRPSIDYYWYTNIINAIKIDNEKTNIQIKKIALLQGD